MVHRLFARLGSDRLRPHSSLILLALATGCGGGAGDSSANQEVAACTCTAVISSVCQIVGGEPCRIDSASGEYLIADGADVDVRGGSAKVSLSGAALSVSDGEVQLAASDGASITVDGGTVSSAGLYDATMLVNGGHVAELVGGNTNLQIRGGNVDYVSVSGDSFASLYGGEVERLDLFERADVALLGGRVVDSIYVQDDSNLTLNGAEVTRDIVTSEDATIAINGGSATELRMFDHSAAHLRGGAVDTIVLNDFFPGRQSASVSVVGSDFNYSLGVLPAADLPDESGSTHLGPLTGTLANGVPFHTSLQLSDAGTVYLCSSTDGFDCACSLAAYRAGSCTPQASS